MSQLPTETEVAAFTAQREAFEQMQEDYLRREFAYTDAEVSKLKDVARANRAPNATVFAAAIEACKGERARANASKPKPPPAGVGANPPPDQRPDARANASAQYNPGELHDPALQKRCNAWEETGVHVKRIYHERNPATGEVEHYPEGRLWPKYGPYGRRY